MVNTPRKIVCIEDEPEMIDLVKLILSRYGFEVVGAHGGLEGLRAIRTRTPDLVLLDLMMPGMDGWEVYQALKGAWVLKIRFESGETPDTLAIEDIFSTFGTHVTVVADSAPGHATLHFTHMVDEIKQAVLKEMENRFGGKVTVLLDKVDNTIRSIPVIVVTAKAHSIDKVLGLHIAKVDDYITKPFGPDELRVSIERILGK